MKTYLKFAGIMFMLVSASWGHVDSLRLNGNLVVTAPLGITPGVQVGGQVFTVGQTVTLNWQVTVQHVVSSYIYFSSTATTSWGTAIATFPSSANQVGPKSYTWTVPNRITTKGRLNVHQALMGFPLSDSTDDYNLATSFFTVQSGTPILLPREQKILSVRSSTGKMLIDFPGIGFNTPTGEFRSLNGALIRTKSLTIQP